jgi:hypothetical protein
MRTQSIIEVGAAVAVLAVGVWLYRRNRAADAGYGSQGAVLLFAVSAILAIHGLGLMRYHPSSSELEAMQARAR